MKYRSFAGAWCRSTRTMFSCLMFSAVAKPSDFRLLSKKSFDLSLLICFGNSVGHVQEERDADICSTSDGVVDVGRSEVDVTS